MVARIRLRGRLEPLLYWIRERENIRLRKEVQGLPPPWTDDPILQKYRFTNVRRKDDRVSRWLQHHILGRKKVFDAAGEDSFIVFTALCRWINWPPTIDRIMKKGLWPVPNPDREDIAHVIGEQISEEGKAFTSAYMITTSGWKYKDKASFVTGPVLDGLIAVIDELKARLEKGYKQRVWELLVTRKFWGPFLSGQVVDDWTWSPLMRHPKDQFTWAPQGPGSVRGYNRIMRAPLHDRHSMDFWCRELQAIREDVITQLGDEFSDMTLMDVQSTLCEIDKYLRIKNREGEMRAYYKPETRF